MKEVQELAIEIARLGMLTGHPEWVEAAKRLEMFASALPLPYSIYEEPLNAVLDALPPEGIPAMMQGAVTFQIRYKKESCAQGFISKEDEGLVTTGPSWRWDDREKGMEW